MTENINGKTRNRKKSQNQNINLNNSKFSLKFKEEKRNSITIKCNNKLISVIDINLMKNMNSSNNNSPKKNISENKEISNDKSNNSNNNTIEKKDSIIKEKEDNSAIKNIVPNLPQNEYNPFEVCNIRRDNDINIIFNGKRAKKSQEELFLNHQYNTIDYFIKSLTDTSKAVKQLREINEAYSSSNLGFFANNKTPTKTEEKNFKISIESIMESIIGKKRNSPCLILSDKLDDIEDNQSKIDLLIKIMEDYKEIIKEKFYCKNFQDRFLLNIYLSLSQISFKLFNLDENSKKYRNLKRYLCDMTDNLKYNLINNPNFTLTSINQKYIDVTGINNRNENINNNDENEIDMIVKNSSSMNFSTHSNNNSSSNSNSNIKNSYEWVYDEDEEEIIYENFEDFNEYNGNYKEYIFRNNNILYETDTFKRNNNTYLENNINLNKKKSNNESNSSSPKLPKNKSRRNATHKIFEKEKIKNYNNLDLSNLPKKEYDFQIIDANSNLENIEIDSDSSIDSDEGCIEIHENHKYEMPKLIFFEDYTKDKEKRKINKNNHLEIRPEPELIKDKIRLKKLSEAGFENIISIINKNPKFLPNHELNLNPLEAIEFIKLREKAKMSFNDSNNNLKKKKFNEKKNNDINNSFLSNISKKSNSFFNEKELSKSKIIDFECDENEELV